MVAETIRVVETKTSGTEADGVGLQCPKCGSSRLRVLETRRHQGNILRRRRCIACEESFSTSESILTQSLQSIIAHGAPVRQRKRPANKIPQDG